MLLYTGAQVEQRPSDPHLQRSRRSVQRRADLGVRLSKHVPKNDGFPLFLVEFLEAEGKQLRELQRVVLVPHHRVSACRSSLVFGPFLERIEASISCDASKPGAEGGSAAVLLKVSICLNEDLLADVLRQRHIPQEGATVAKNLGPIAPHEHRDDLARAPLCQGPPGFVFDTRRHSVREFVGTVR